MKNSIRIIFISLSLLILLLFVIFLINQTVQIVELAQNVHPVFAKIVFWILMAVYLGLLLIPVFMYLRLPKALIPPDEEDSVEMEIYLKQLSSRLKKNPHLRGEAVNSREQIELALEKLNIKTNAEVKKIATTVFLTTAISQSGRLDTFTVLISLVKMVWRVARIYNQRPSLREMLHLYANVAATAFIAGELDDLDISQQVEPVVGSVLGGTLTSAIPGINAVAGIITNSLLTGAANAYLTLRIGMITKKYSGTIIQPDRRKIRRSASVEAARMLSVIVMNSAGRISRSIVNAAVKSPGKFSRDLIRNTWDKVSGKRKPDIEVSGDL